jgi:Trk K+ transport system NAD-binding subunit
MDRQFAVDFAGHVIVCGGDETAVRTVEQLWAVGAAVAVVDADGEASPAAERLLAGWGIPLVRGRLRESLAEAGLARATAVVCLVGDDLAALEAALLVRRLRPDARLVVRMGNAEVGRALAEVVGEGRVLDVAALAAPSFAEACLGRRTHELRLAGRDVLVADLVADRDTSLRDRWGDLAPLAVATPDAPTVLCPGRDHAVRAGDVVTAVGTPEQFARHGAEEVVLHLAPQAPVRPVAGARSAGARRAAEREDTGPRPGLFALLRSLAAEADRPLRAVAAVLAGLIVVSVVVLSVGYVKPDGTHMTVVDAVYFTVETIATVGYGDFNFADQDTWLRVYAIGLMTAGTVLSAVTFALITQLLVSRRIERSFGHRRVGAMRGHVVVVGLGTVGVAVVEELVAAGRRVVVIDRDEAGRHLARVRALDVPVVVGDATDTAVLDTANLAEATAVAVLTSDDLVNVETGLVVRERLGPRWARVPVALRVFDRELAGGIEDGFGFRSVRSTAELAAPWFVGAALGLDVVGTFYVDRTPFVAGALTVAPGGGLDGLAMGELSERARVAAIRRADGRAELPPRRDTTFAAGDEAFLVGPHDEVVRVLLRDSPTPSHRDAAR